MTTETTERPTLWITREGAVYCRQHVGTLRDAILLTAEAQREYGAEWLDCETCQDEIEAVAVQA